MKVFCLVALFVFVIVCLQQSQCQYGGGFGGLLPEFTKIQNKVIS